MAKHTTVSEKVISKIERGGPGSMWTYADFKGLSFGAVAKALSRLTAANRLVRVRKGIYYSPKETVLGPSTVSMNDLLRELEERKNKVLYPDSATSAYNLRITTQVPAVAVMVGELNYSSIDYKGSKVKIYRRKVSHLKHLPDDGIYMIETLRKINSIPGASAKDVVGRLKVLLKSFEDIELLLLASKSEPPRVRAILGAICSDICINSDLLLVIKKSLNPLTKYKLGLKHVLRSASEWNIE